MTLLIVKKYVISFLQDFAYRSVGKDFLPHVTNSKFWGGMTISTALYMSEFFWVWLSTIYCRNVRSKLSYELAIIAGRVAPLLLETTPTSVAQLVIYSCKFHVCMGLMKV